MTRFAVISDVHANMEALDEVLGHLKGTDIICLGDLVDYGANPNEAVERVREKARVVLLGNHDQAAVTGDASMFNAKAAISSRWTRSRLTEENAAYLKGLPRESACVLDGVKSYFAHGSPDDPLWEYVQPATHHLLFGHYLSRLGAGLIGLGHTHVPFVWKEGRGVVFNPGSVGQPRDGDPRASWAVVNVEGGSARVDVMRTEYDSDAAAAKIRKAGLPGFFADRLKSGT